MKITARRIAGLVAMALVVASCGGSDSARQRNTALSEKNGRLPYSCAQLMSEEIPSVDNPVVRFKLCDNAVSYSVTPFGSDLISEIDVREDKEIEVDVDVNDPTNVTSLTVFAADENDGSIVGSGIHRYLVSVGPTGVDVLGEGHPRADEPIVAVDYKMPAPQVSSFYNGGVLIEQGVIETHIDYVDELMQKWSMIAQRTCYESPTLARMARQSTVATELGESLIAAKRMRNRNYFDALTFLRLESIGWRYQPLDICAPGEFGYNMFSDGVEVGFAPLKVDEISENTNLVALVKTFAVIHLDQQILDGICEQDELSVVGQSGGVEQVRDAVLERLGTLAESRVDAKVASDQVELLQLLSETRRSTGWNARCQRLAAGYAVPVKRIASRDSVPAEDAAPTEVTVVTQQVPDEAPTTTYVATTIAPAAAASVTLPVPALPAAAQWKQVKPTLRVKAGSSLSKSRLLTFAGLKAPKGSKVRVSRAASSKARCTATKWGIKGRKAGSCRVTVKVTPKKGKAKAKTITVTVTR